MSDYAIGDVQGCYTQLINLLELIGFDDKKDRLWFVGDLVNRGPDSLRVMRFVRNLTIKPIITLGNHDLHFLACAYGVKHQKVMNTVKYRRVHQSLEQDSLDELLSAPDCLALSHWLRQQKLLHFDEKFNVVMTHAGIYPLWNLSQAQALAEEAERFLQGNDYLDFFKHMYGNEPSQWSDALKGMDRLRFIINALTRMRFCNVDGRLNLTYKGTLEQAPADIIPWFNLPARQQIKPDLVFGHWAALKGQTKSPDLHAIDTGCLWGGQLTALRLQDKRLFQVPGYTAKH